MKIQREVSVTLQIPEGIDVADILVWFDTMGPMFLAAKVGCTTHGCLVLVLRPVQQGVELSIGQAGCLTASLAELAPVVALDAVMGASPEEMLH